MFCISMYSEGTYQYETTPALYDQVYILKLVIIYHGYIYRISICFVFPRTVKVSIRNYTWTIRASVHLEIDHFLSWLYIQDFRMFCISIYSEGINTKLHLDNKSKCTS